MTTSHKTKWREGLIKQSVSSELIEWRLKADKLQAENIRLITRCDELGDMVAHENYRAQKILDDNASLTDENQRLRKALESLKATDQFDPHVMTYLILMIDKALRGND